jgi:precorrin-6x reductase
MSGSKTISLLIPADSPPQAEDLQAKVQKIVAQKGHFRHVTEQSLLAQIHGKAVAPEEENRRVGESGQADEDETPQKRQERLWKSREEMLERLR